MIKVTNAQHVKHVLTTVVPREARNLVRSTVHGVAGEVRDEIRRTAPDDPRTRKNDIVRSTRTRRERIRGNYFSSTVRIGAFYWRFLEYGTIKLAPRSFVLRAAAKLHHALPRLFIEQFGKKLEARLNRVRR